MDLETVITTVVSTGVVGAAVSYLWTEWRSTPVLDSRVMRVSPFRHELKVTIYNRARRPLPVTGLRVRPVNAWAGEPALAVVLQPHTMPFRDQIALDLRIAPFLQGASDWPSADVECAITTDAPLIGAVDIEVRMQWQRFWRQRGAMTVQLRLPAL